MPAAKKSATIHRLTGTYRGDRHAREVFKVAPIDPTPPPHLGDAAADAWRELVTAGADWLTNSDRLAVEIAANLMAIERSGQGKAAHTAQLVGLLQRLGLTPAGRRGLEPAKKPGESGNEFDQF